MHRMRKSAELLRDKGYSYNLIHEKTGVPVSTMSYWFKDKPFIPNAQVLGRIKSGPGKVGIYRHNLRVKEIQRLKTQGIKEVGKLSKRDLWLLGLGVYIGEGSKTTEIIRVSNSDPDIIRLSLLWFKVTCGASNKDFAIRIHIYPDHNPEKCIRYWQNITGLSKENFRKVSVDLRTDKKTLRSHKLPYGTAHLTLQSNGDPEKGVRLFRRIDGWMSGALKQV